MKKTFVILGILAVSATASFARIAACGQGNTQATLAGTGQSVVCCDLGGGLLSCTDGDRWFHAQEV